MERSVAYSARDPASKRTSPDSCFFKDYGQMVGLLCERICAYREPLK